jgi:hypothetical protein
MLEMLDRFNWAEIPQPAGNSLSEVPDALRAVMQAANEKDAEIAYHRLLFAVGNDHCGTYCPVVLPVIPFLGEVLRGGSSIARETTLDVLFDLVCSFSPEPEFETVFSPSGQEMPLQAALLNAVAELKPQISACASSAVSSSRESSLARELLSELN